MKKIPKILLIPLVIHLMFAVGLIYVQKPYEDEGLFGNAAYNLSYNGFMGIPGVEQGNDWVNLDKAVFWIPPASMVFSALWFKISGFGLFQQRILAVFWGILGIIAIYYFLKFLGFNKKNIFITLILVSTDFLYTRHSADGRICDIMCASVVFLSFTSYLLLREKNFRLALLISNTFVMIAGLTHPNGLLGFFGLIFLALYFDLKKIVAKDMLISFIPYLVGGIGVSIYILNNFDAFRSQFFGNINLAIEGRTVWSLIYSEIVSRYLFIYAGVGTKFAVYQRFLIFIPLLYLLSFIYSGFKTKENDSIKIVFFLTLIFFVTSTFLFGKKWPRYLIYIIPLYSCCISFMFTDLKNKIVRNAIGSWIVLVVVLSLGVNLYRFKRNEYGKHISDINKIKQIVPPNEDIIAPIELGYSLDWGRISADGSIGYFSKKEYKFLIINSDYESYFELYKLTAPDIYRHIIKMLDEKYKVILRGKIYKLYKHF